MTAVHLVIVAVHGDRVVMRCVARLGDTAICLCPIDRCRRDARELIAAVLDLFLILGDADIRLALFICAQTGLHSPIGVCTAEVDSVVVLQQADIAPIAVHRQRVPVDLRLPCTGDIQHCAACSNAVRVEVHLLEAFDALRRVLSLDIQRIRLVRIIVRCRTADDLVRDRRVINVDGVPLRCRTVAARDGFDRGVADRDRVVRRFTGRMCLAADNVARDRLADRDLVARRVAARHIGIAAVDLASDIRGTAHLDFVQRAVLLLICRSVRARAARPTAVGIPIGDSIGDRDLVLCGRIAEDRTSTEDILV